MAAVILSLASLSVARTVHSQAAVLDVLREAVGATAVDSVAIREDSSAVFPGARFIRAEWNAGGAMTTPRRAAAIVVDGDWRLVTGTDGVAGLSGLGEPFDQLLALDNPVAWWELLRLSAVLLPQDSIVSTPQDIPEWQRSSLTPGSVAARIEPPRITRTADGISIRFFTYSVGRLTAVEVALNSRVDPRVDVIGRFPLDIHRE